MSLLGDGTVGHGPGLEPLYNGLRAFHFLDGNAAVFLVFKIHQAPQVDGLPLLIESMTVFFKNLIVPCPGRLLQEMDGPGIIQMLLLPGPLLMAAHALQCQIHIQPQGIKCRGVKQIHIICNIA